MAIRLRDSNSYLGRIASTLGPAAAVFSGTFAAAVTRTGTIASSLQPATAALVGIFSSAPNRTGTIASTLQNATASMVGGLSLSVTASQDWTNRGTIGVNGVVQAIRFNSATNVTAWTHGSGNPTRVTHVTTDGIIGDGCLNFNVLAADGEQSGNWRIPLNASWTSDANAGILTSDYYIQFRCKLGTNRLIAANGDQPGGVSGGFKLAIVGGYSYASPGSSSSDIDAEVVVTNPTWLNLPVTYNHSTGQNVQRFQGGIAGQTIDGQAITTTQQPARDRGASFTDNRQRFCVYVNAGEPKTAGCWEFVENQWFTVYLHIKQATPGGSSGNRIELYVARDGETTYTKLFDETAFAWAAGSDAPRGPVALWLTPFDSHRTNSSVSTTHRYDQVIVSTQPIACPQAAFQPPQTEPTWMASVSNLQRVQPLSNWLGDAAVKDPIADTTNAGDGGGGHQKIFRVWTGAGNDYAGGNVFLLGNGGHNDYWGNEVYSTRLLDNSPLWRRLRNATASNTPRTGIGSNFTLWSDGRPTSMHTYHSQVADNAGRWWLLGVHATNYTGGGLRQRVFEFLHPTTGLDNTSNDWVSRGDILANNGNTGNGIAMYDKTGDRLIHIYGGNSQPSLQLIRPSDRVVTAENNNTINDGVDGWVGGFDQTHRCVLLRGNSGWYTLRMSNPTGAYTTPSITGSAAPSSREHLCWHTASNAFLTWKDGTGLVKGVPTVNGSGDITSVAWSAVATTGVSVPSVAASGLMNKVGIIPTVGGREMFWFIPDYGNKDLIAIPLPLAGV